MFFWALASFYKPRLFLKESTSKNWRTQILTLEIKHFGSLKILFPMPRGPKTPNRNRWVTNVRDFQAFFAWVARHFLSVFFISRDARVAILDANRRLPVLDDFLNERWCRCMNQGCHVVMSEKGHINRKNSRKYQKVKYKIYTQRQF